MGCSASKPAGYEALAKAGTQAPGIEKGAPLTGEEVLAIFHAHVEKRSKLLSVRRREFAAALKDHLWEHVAEMDAREGSRPYVFLGQLYEGTFVFQWGNKARRQAPRDTAMYELLTTYDEASATRIVSPEFLEVLGEAVNPFVPDVLKFGENLYVYVCANKIKTL